MRVDLPDGEYAELSDPSRLTGIQIESVLGLAGEAGLDMESLQSSGQLRLMPVLLRCLVASLVESWTLKDGDEPRPISAATVGALTYDELEPLYTAVHPGVSVLLKAFGSLGPKSARAS